ncbi:MAG: cytochrome C [Deltaproteobacteria bacterium]|nr:cytochrome C [Deltaproteobacteria bacterium]
MELSRWAIIAGGISFFLAILIFGFIPGHAGPFPLAEMDPSGFPAPNTGCLASAKCHLGIEPIRGHNSRMAQKIYARGLLLGDPNGCVVCHGGNRKEEKDTDLAHRGAPEGSPFASFNRHSGSVWINDRTCGQCHAEWVYAEHRSLMQTEAGKIQGALWGWGPAGTGYETCYGNYSIDDPDGPVPIFGSKQYRSYMQEMMRRFPNNFPEKLERLPEVDLDTISEHPEQAVYTYIRSECQRCHLGVRGRDKRGDFRGMGCAACHIPYSNEGYYEGSDPSIPKDKKGHPLVHSIQASKEAKVVVNGKVYSGIPSETCASCHNRGKRIGVSFQGLMEFPYGTPLTETGDKMLKLHTKYYLYIRDDLHHRIQSRKGNPPGGLLCQDCHSTTSIHGNGNLSGTTLAEVEIECTDCHGTPTHYPWELPMGWGDEFGRDLEMGQPRGVTRELLVNQKEYNTLYPSGDGYLLTTRGNPFGNVVRRDNRVILHSASGLDFEVPQLKTIAQQNRWQTPERAPAAMINVKSHLKRLECYTCHSTWGPQCYGCHVKVDYSKGKRSIDWIASGSEHFPDGHTAESRRDGKAVKGPGKAYESRGYLRWEDPVLGINGEGRVSPIMPGCQQITTVIGPDGKTLVQNKIWRTPAGLENSGPEGQRGIDMAPSAPHTRAREARPCVSCHTSSKALGYGACDGRYLKGYTKGFYADITTATGELLSKKARLQIPPIPDLPMGYDQVVTRDDKQVQTVGHHWPLSGPLPKEVRDRVEKVGTCLRCHKSFPTGTFKAVHKKDFHSEIMGNLLKLDRSFHDLSSGSVGEK